MKQCGGALTGSNTDHTDGGGARRICQKSYRHKYQTEIRQMEVYSFRVQFNFSLCPESLPLSKSAKISQYTIKDRFYLYSPVSRPLWNELT